MLKRRAVKRTFVLIYAVSMFIGVTPGVQSIAGEPVATNDATVPVDDGSSTNEETAVETAASTQPNFVLILTDDQKWDTIGRCMPELDPYDFNAGADACMPNLQELLTSNGLTFLHGNVTQSLCCPSRASILTGQYTTTNGVTYNNAQLLDDTSTLATWLEAAGYRNGLVGKYLNGYGLGPLAEHIPPGWDRWETFHDFRNSDNPYTDYPWISWREGDTDPVVTRINDADSTSSEACADGNLYSTDYMCNLAIDFLQEDTETPFFLHLSPASPHLPLSVADRHLNAFQGMNIPRYPSTNVLPSPNTPSHLPPTDLPDRVLDRIERTMVTSIELTLTVDDMIGVVHDELQSDGRLDNTVWIFISDNGISSGEHHWRNKGCEYYTCHQVPYVVVCPTGVCPGAIPGSVDGDNYALNIDIAPTIADLAGATPTIGVDGSSLVPLLNDPNVELRDEWFMHGNDPEYEGIAGVGTDGDWYKYVELTSAGEFEMYNLADDPWEIVNLAGNGDYADVEADLAARLAAHLGGPPPNIPPIGSFTSACTDLACDFTDTSTDSDGSVVGWDWDFGDGSGTSTVQSPSYTYVSAGTYPVSLTVTDDDGATDTVTEDVTLSGGNVDPVASFTSSCTDLGCDFTDTSTDLDGSVVGWDWDFGDGSGTSTVQSPSYTYVSAGTYSVSLTVTDDDGATDMVTEDVTVSEGNVDPVASFTSSCTDLACDFTDTSTDADGSVVGWDWDFGDGSGTSTVQSPSYTFSAAGTYSVSLTVTDDDGATDTVTEDVTVSEGNLDPTASFSWLCTDLACDFTDESTDSDGTVVSWDWDFGDGTGTSTVQSPSYTYVSAGMYSVSLTVTDDDGATDTVTEDVTVSEGNLDPTASFTSLCTDLGCDFTDTSTDSDGSVVGWDWDFGDGSGTSTVQSPSYTFSPAGTYSVSLTVTDDDGATDTVTEDVTVSEGNLDPTASFSWLCADLACDFTDESTDSDGTVVSWDWDFGDGSGTSTVQSPSYVFSSAGTYPVELTVTDDDGATDVVTRDVTVTTAGGAGAFIESDGTVVFEAESYFDSITRSGDTWTEVTDPSGFSGDGAMQTLPDDGTRLRTDLPSTSPEMTYEVDFTATGTYFVWVRTWAPDVRSKGVFVGIDGVVSTGLSAGGNENWADGVGEWAWSNVGRLPAPVTVEVTTAGVHTIQVFMGDDGLIMDKVVLTTDAGFVPTDEGPPESPRQPI